MAMVRNTVQTSSNETFRPLSAGASKTDLRSGSHAGSRKVLDSVRSATSSNKVVDFVTIANKEDRAQKAE